MQGTQNVDAAWFRVAGSILRKSSTKHVPLKPITIRPNNKVWMTRPPPYTSCPNKNIASSPQPNVRALPRPGKLTSKPETCATLHSKKQNRHSWSSCSRTNFLHWLTAAACGGARQRLSQGLAHLPSKFRTSHRTVRPSRNQKRRQTPLARYFAQQCTALATDKESDHCPAPYPLQENQPAFNFPAILPCTVHRHLRRLSQNKSTSWSGYDKPGPSRMRLVNNWISHLSLVGLSVSTGTFPSAWKNAIVIPVFKRRGRDSDPSNYRPVSLLPPLGKVLDAIQSEHLLSFLEKNGLTKQTPVRLSTSSLNRHAAHLRCGHLDDCVGPRQATISSVHGLQKGVWQSLAHWPPAQAQCNDRSCTS